MGLRAEVSEIVGGDIEKIDTTLETYENVVFEWDTDNKFRVTSEMDSMTL